MKQNWHSADEIIGSSENLAFLMKYFTAYLEKFITKYVRSTEGKDMF